MSERNSTVPIRRIEVSSYTVPADFPVDLNPNRPKTRIAKNPEVQRLIASGHKLTTEEQKEQYKKIVQKISALIENAGVSIEVFADLNTTAEQMPKDRRCFPGFRTAMLSTRARTKDCGPLKRQ